MNESAIPTVWPSAAELEPLGVGRLHREGSIIFEAGWPASSVLVVRAGLVHLDGCVADATNSGLFGHGEIIGAQEAARNSRRAASARAIRDSVLVHVSAERFQCLLRSRKR